MQTVRVGSHLDGVGSLAPQADLARRRCVAVCENVLDENADFSSDVVIPMPRRTIYWRDCGFPQRKRDETCERCGVETSSPGVARMPICSGLGLDPGRLGLPCLHEPRHPPVSAGSSWERRHIGVAGPPEAEVLTGLSPVPFSISSNLGLDPIVLPFLSMSASGRTPSLCDPKRTS